MSEPTNMSNETMDPTKTTDDVLDDTKAARDRARQCHEAIVRVLAEFDCRLVTALTYDPVGAEGARALIGSTYGIVPNL